MPVIILTAMQIATHTCKLLLREKPAHWDINTVLLQFFSTDKLFKSISNIMQNLLWIVNVQGENVMVAGSTPPPPRHTTCKKPGPIRVKSGKNMPLVDAHIGMVVLLK